MPGSERSSTYCAAPVTFARPSLRGTGLPMFLSVVMDCFPEAGQIVAQRRMRAEGWRMKWRLPAVPSSSILPPSSFPLIPARAGSDVRPVNFDRVVGHRLRTFGLFPCGATACEGLAQAAERAARVAEDAPEAPTPEGRVADVVKDRVGDGRHEQRQQERE